MHLKILLPFQVFADQAEVVRIVADTHDGSFGFWPRRLDCVASLVPGILIYETESRGEVYTAIDEGVLVKFGLEVLISVRNAIAGSDLGHLQAEVKKQFLTLDDQQQSVRSTMAKLETAVVQRLAEMHHD
jgi:F-type H+-transporting ATPase subunit epsilon